MWTIVVGILLGVASVVTALGIMNPDFDDQIVNITVKEKATAVLPCSVINLGNYQMVWTDQYSTLLTHEDRRIIDDDRVSVERPYPRDWNLHIRDVRYSDQGLYNCQINTEPVRVKMVYLNVQVPSKILENLSTRNVTIKEGEKVTLVCNATGFPQPTVTWFRITRTEKGEDKQKVGVDGEVLVIHNVTRHCGGSYQCVAYNGVQPAATRVIDVSVRFPPEVNLPNMRIGQTPGKDTILECTVSAHPISDVWWQRNNEKISSQDLKYRVEIYDETMDELTLSLRIFNLEHADFGVYTCYASNKLGGDQQDMILYDYNRHLRTTTTTTTTTAVSTTSTFYLPRRHPDHYNNNNGGGKYQNGYNRHEPNGQGQGGYNVQGRLYQGEDEGQGRGYSKDRGHGGGRPGSLTGNHESEHIYTPPYHTNNNGNVKPAQAREEGTDNAPRVSPNVAVLVIIGIVVSFVTSISTHL